MLSRGTCANLAFRGTNPSIEHGVANVCSSVLCAVLTAPPKASPQNMQPPWSPWRQSRPMHRIWPPVSETTYAKIKKNSARRT
jgi:hypothetical protein